MQLVALYNYVPVAQLPANMRNAFIADDQSPQDQSNIFINDTKTTCHVG